jgi:hypothetical protein
MIKEILAKVSDGLYLSVLTRFVPKHKLVV